MDIPPVYTAAGVGGAIPIASLADEYLLITTIVGPTTIPAITIQGTTIGSRTVSGTVIPATTIPAHTYPATTVSVGVSATITEGTNPSAVAGSGPKTGGALSDRTTNVGGLLVCLMTVLICVL
jgi:hypothetical protein